MKEKIITKTPVRVLPLLEIYGISTVPIPIYPYWTFFSVAIVVVWKRSKSGRGRGVVWKNEAQSYWYKGWYKMKRATFDLFCHKQCNEMIMFFLGSWSEMAKGGGGGGYFPSQIKRHWHRQKIVASWGMKCESGIVNTWGRILWNRVMIIAFR